MIFVDSNVFIYAVGRAHPLKKEAQGFFLEAKREETRLVTSAEVLQELLHVYIPVIIHPPPDFDGTVVASSFSRTGTIVQTNPSIARKCLSKVISSAPRSIVCAAIHISFAGIGVPLRLSWLAILE